jgi:hypothetical protein
MTTTARACILCWAAGRNVAATVFVDPGWYCAACAPTMLGWIDGHEFRRGVKLGLVLGIASLLIALAVLVALSRVM